jgi:hypothetical protein
MKSPMGAFRGSRHLAMMLLLLGGGWTACDNSDSKPAGTGGGSAAAGRAGSGGSAGATAGHAGMKGDDAGAPESARGGRGGSGGFSGGGIKAGTAGIGSGNAGAGDGPGGGSGSSGKDAGGGQTGGGTGPPSASQCELDVSCGGDIVGTWRFVNLCQPLTPDQIETFPDLENCDTGTGTATYAGDQTITFAEDGSATASVYGDGVSTVVIDVPQLCISGEGCASLATMFSRLTGSWTDEGGTCHYVGTDAVSGDQADDGSFTTQGNQITFVDEGEFSSHTPETWEYCVTGDTMSWRRSTSTGGVAYVSLSRIP